MNISSINTSSNASSNYLQSASASSSTPQSSAFAQMLLNSGSGTSTSASGTSSSGASKSGASNPNQLLTQLVGSFQSNTVQNETQSLDPMSMLS